MIEQKIIDLACNRLPVEMIIKTDSVLQPDLYTKNFDYSFVIILQKVNQTNLDILHLLKKDIQKKLGLNVSFEVLTNGEFRLIPKKKHSFLSALLTIYVKLGRAKVVYQSNNLVGWVDVDKDNICFASSLCSQELVEAFRKMFLKARFVSKEIESDIISQKKIHKIVEQEVIIAQNILSTKNNEGLFDRINKLLSLPSNKVNYSWLDSIFGLSEELHSMVINNE